MQQLVGKLSKINHIDWLIIFIVLVGIILRSWKFWYFPIIGATQDEVAWTILGSSLLQTGVPISWSHFSGYQVFETLWSGGNHFPLVKPVLDHPPLFSLIPGLWNTVLGNAWKAIPDIKYMRVPIVGLAAINLVLFATWIRTQVKNQAWQLVAIMLAASVPSVVFMSRLVISENLLVTWELLLLLLQGKQWRQYRWWKYLVFLIHAALPLTKIAGLPIIAASLAVAIQYKDRRWLKEAIAGSLTGVVALLTYVAIYDWDLFWSIQLQQANRTTGLLTLFSTWIWRPVLAADWWAEPWVVLGLASLLVLAMQPFNTKSLKPSSKTTDWVRWLFLGQLAFLLLSVGEHTFHGWYKIPFWPLWIYAVGWAAAKIWKQKRYMATTLAWIVCLPIIRLGIISTWGKEFYAHQDLLNKILLILAASSLWPLLHHHSLAKKWNRYSVVMLVVLLFLTQALTVLFLSHETFWQDSLYLQEGIRP